MRLFEITPQSGGHLVVQAPGPSVQIDYNVCGSQAKLNLSEPQAVGLARSILRHYNVKTIDADVKPGQVWDCTRGRRLVILDDKHCIEIDAHGEFRGPVLVTAAQMHDIATKVGNYIGPSIS